MKLIKINFSPVFSPTIVHKITPSDCMYMLKGYRFKFVHSTPIKINKLANHFVMYIFIVAPFLSKYDYYNLSLL